ncbi:F-box domain-containing protein [Mycena kentingensis (nom. inval.)]|nr:F-box domain-containing protein [Mycena kentingensis (nom. inval.)]
MMPTTNTTAALRTQLAELERAISLQQQHLAELEASRDAVDAELKRVAAYDILSLPNEITAQIFVHCLPLPWQPASQQLAPLLLYRVCQKWADIASTTPDLWRSLTLDVSLWNQQDAASLFKTWFVGAGNGSRRLSLTEGIAAHDGAEVFMSIFRSWSPRVTHLTLGPGFDRETCALFTGLDMPELEELRIRPCEWLEARGMISNAPKLRKVVVESFDLAVLTIPWSQITEFHCDEVFMSHVLAVLQLLPNVEHFEARVVDEEEVTRPDDDEPIVFHPKIKWLRVQDEQRKALQVHLLQFLTLPALERLDTDALLERNFDDFLGRSKSDARLTSLCFSSKQHPTLYIDVLGYLTHLVDLTLRFPSWAIWSELLPPLSIDETFLPCLEKLAIECQEVDGAYHLRLETIVESLPAAVKARNALADVRRGTSSLRTMKALKLAMVFFHPWVELRLPDKLLTLWRELKEDGLDVYVGDDEKNLLASI